MTEPLKIISQDQLLPVQAKVDVKALTEDDSIVPVHQWDDRLLSTCPVTSVLEGKSRKVYARLYISSGTLFSESGSSMLTQVLCGA